MSLDSFRTVLTDFGEVRVREGRIEIEGFAGVNCSCRDVSVLSMVWAIGQLQAELSKRIEDPNNESVVVIV